MKSHKSRTERGNRSQFMKEVSDMESRNELRAHTLGTATPLYSSSAIDRIVRGRETGINNRVLVQYADGQTLELRVRPETTDERIRELASDPRYLPCD
jgi:hypothetical protein